MTKLSEIIKSTVEIPLSTAVILNIMCTKNMITERFEMAFKETEITEKQYNVLRILRGQKGVPCSLQVIQERMIHKNSNTGRIIDKLILKNLVKRCVCSTNRRKVEISITEKGLDILEEMAPELDNINNATVKHLTTAEMETLNILLEKLRKQ